MYCGKSINSSLYHVNPDISNVLSFAEPSSIISVTIFSWDQVNETPANSININEVILFNIFFVPVY